jgi:hypothetical protein
MLAGAVRKKRPCSVCRCWFLPDVRVGDRQHACDREACQRERHRRADRRWRSANRDYDRDRRWRESIAAAKAEPSSPPPAANAPPPTSGLPWDVVQDEMGVQDRVILAGVVRVMGVFVQDEIRRQATEIVARFGRHAPWAVQDEIDPGG